MTALDRVGLRPKNDRDKREAVVTVLPFSDHEIERARADTPAVFSRLHLDNCGAALMPKPVVDTIRAHMELEEVKDAAVEEEDKDEADPDDAI